MTRYVPYVDAIQYDGSNDSAVASFVDSTHPGLTTTGSSGHFETVDGSSVTQFEFDMIVGQWLTHRVEILDDGVFGQTYTELT